VSFREEKDIFSFLGLAYREPHTREVDATWLAETAPFDGLSPHRQLSHRVPAATKTEDGEVPLDMDEVSDKAFDVEVVDSD
jgi:hypothetical protein